MKKKLLGMMMLCLCFALVSVTRAELVARYTFDDGTAADDSGNANNGVLTGGLTVVTDAERGPVLNFDGAAGSFMRIPNSASLNAVASQITIGMWVYWTEGATDQLIEKGGTSGSAWYIAPWGIRKETDNTLRLNWGNQSPEPALLSSAVPLGTWTHVAMTYDSTLASNQRKFYINGVLDQESNWTGGATPNTYDIYVGCDYYNNTDRWQYAGLMDDLQIHDIALTEGEIAQVMTGGGVTNIYPGNGQILVPVSAVLSWDPPAEAEPNFVFSGYDVYFDVNEMKVEAGDPTKRVATNDPAETYDPFGASDMAYLTPYFWRVDVVGTYIGATEPNILAGSVFRFTTETQAPTITGQPVNQVRGPANGKSDAEFSVTAANATDYQWYKDNVAINGATDSTLTITDVQLSDEGQYYCAVSNDNSPTIVNSDTVWLEYARQTGDWAFEQDLVDSIGGNNGTFYDPNVSTGSFDAGRSSGYAVLLDGTNDYVDLPVNALPKAGTELTIAFWTKNMTPTAGTVTVYAYADAAPGNRLVNIHTPWSSNTAYLDVSNSDAGTGYDRVSAGSAVVTTGDPYWIHWIFTKDAETGVMRIYRDGVQVGQSTGQNRFYYGADHLQLGANRDTLGVLGQFYNGLLDDLEIYNYYMDEVEAAYLYYDASGEKVCINANDPVVAAYDFNGNCKIDLPDFAELAVNWLHCQQVPNCVARP